MIGLRYTVQPQRLLVRRRVDGGCMRGLALDLLRRELWATVGRIDCDPSDVDALHPDEWVTYSAGPDGEYTCYLPADWTERAEWCTAFSKWVAEHQGCELVCSVQHPLPVYVRHDFAEVTSD